MVRSSVTDLLCLLLLSDEVVQFLKSGKIEMGHARALLNLEPEKQCEIARKIIDKKLSVREAEKLVQKAKQPSNLGKDNNKFENQIYAWEQLLSSKLSSVVKVNLNNQGEGRVIISIRSPEEIEWLIDKLK